MKKLTLNEARTMLKLKRGAGVAKHTRIKLDMDIEFDSGVPAAEILVDSLVTIIEVLVHHKSEFPGYSLKNTTIKDNSFVETQLESNQEWEIPTGMTEPEKEEVRRDHVEGDDLD